MSSILTAPPFAYDKSKNLLLKAVLPFLIIVHHVLIALPSNGLQFIEQYGGHIAMFAFFGMSGFGLVHCYLNKEGYLNGFLKKSLFKLFVPYFSALILFCIYRFTQGTTPIEYFCNTNPLDLVSCSWFIFVLASFYVVFHFVFKYLKTSDTTKVLCICAFVLLYIIALTLRGSTPHHYNRCLSFCIGMFIALYDNKIRSLLIQWQAIVIMLLLASGLVVTFVVSSCSSIFLLSAIVTCLLFILLYSTPSFKAAGIIKFFSSICIEMYVVQGIAIDFVILNLQINSFYAAIPLVLLIDILLAYIVHRIDRWVLRKITV